MTPRQFRDIIESLGLTQAETASCLGVSTRAVELWLAGQRRISVPVQMAIATLKKKPPPD